MSAPPAIVVADGTQRERLTKLLRRLEALARGKFFGKVTIEFQNGSPSNVRTETNEKVDEL